MEKILIVRLGAMGDILHALPAVTALRKANPQARIGWVVERRWQALLSEKLVDQIHLADTKQWRKHPLEGWSALRALRHELRAESYDCCFDLQGAMKSAAIASMSGAKRVVGNARPRESLAKFFYDDRVRTRKPHVIEQAAEICGVALPSRAEAADQLPRGHVTEDWCEAELVRRGASRFAILNPGAGWLAKQWPAERYGEVAKQLMSMGVKSLVNFAPSELALAQRVEAASGGAATKIECSIPQLIALTRRAALFIGGDTGPLHLANLLGVPVVAIFGPTDPARNGPYYTPNVVLRSAASATSYAHSATRDEGLLSITTAQVVEAAQSLLQS